MQDFVTMKKQGCAPYDLNNQVNVFSEGTVVFDQGLNFVNLWRSKHQSQVRRWFTEFNLVIMGTKVVQKNW